MSLWGGPPWLKVLGRPRQKLKVSDPGLSYARIDEECPNANGVVVRALRAACGALRRAKDRDGSRAQREVLARRTAALLQVLDGVDLAPILDGAARNSIEHFDEYVDDAAVQSYLGAIPRPTLFAVDMVLNTRSVLRQFDVSGERPTIYFILAYIADERVFSNCSRELRMEPLRDCCSMIRQRVEPLLPDFAREEP